MEVDAIKKQAIRCLTSTDALVKQLGAKWDGPRFRFNCQLHRSPYPRFLKKLALMYMHEVIIPNALISYELGRMPDDSWMDALDYCMRTNKSPGSVASWEEAKADPCVTREAEEDYRFFVLGLKRDGTAQGAGKPWPIRKYIKLPKIHFTMKTRGEPEKKKRKKSRNQIEAEKLLERSKTEQELLSMNREELMKIGISQRTADAFIKLRK